MRVGCYTLDLYCDDDTGSQLDTKHFDGSFAQFTGHTESRCIKQARAKGWLLGERDLCPLCSGKKVKA